MTPVRVSGTGMSPIEQDSDLRTRFITPIKRSWISHPFGLKIDIDIEEFRCLAAVDEGVNRLQNLRKSSGLDVVDRIDVTIQAEDAFASSLASFEEYVKDEVLADAIHWGTTTENSTEVEGHEICISISKN